MLAKQSFAQPVLAQGKLLGLAQLFDKLRFSEDSSTSRFGAWPYTSGSDKGVYRWGAWIRKARQRSLHEFVSGTTNAVAPRNLGYISLDVWTTGISTTALLVEQGIGILTFQ